MDAGDVLIGLVVGVSGSVAATILTQEMAPHFAGLRRWRVRRSTEELSLLADVEAAPAIGAGLAAYTAGMLALAGSATAAAAISSILTPKQPTLIKEGARYVLHWPPLLGAYTCASYWRDLAWCREALVDPARLRTRVRDRLARLDPDTKA